MGAFRFAVAIAWVATIGCAAPHHPVTPPPPPPETLRLAEAPASPAPPPGCPATTPVADDADPMTVDDGFRSARRRPRRGDHAAAIL